jgi:hypothetical protein
MLELTPEKVKEIGALVANATPATAARMLAMFERVKVKGSQAIPINVLISALRDAGIAHVVGKAMGVARLPSFQRMFFEPFERLFENGELQDLLPGSLPRSGLAEAWEHIASWFASEAVREHEPVATAAILSGDIATAYEHAAQLRAELLINLSRYGNATIAQHASTPACKAVMQRLVPLLTAEAAGREIWRDAGAENGKVSDLNDLSVAGLDALVRQFEDQNPEAARELLLLTMANLPRPHQALRVLNKVSLGVDDRKLDMTEFAVIGRRPIAVAQREADKVEAAFTTGQFDGQELARTVDRYNQCLHGLERETRLATDGPWRHSVVELRSKVGKRLELLCQHTSTLLETALPLQRLQRPSLAWVQEPRLDNPIDSEKVKGAVCHLHFIGASRLFAPLAGFGAPRQQAYSHALAHLDLVRDALLKANKLGHKPRHLADWIVATRDIIEAIDGTEAAQIFDRRIAAASGAAAA